ncbi:hypothetical protein OZ401_004613 (plasmid) [Candidatus Chlorohelix allophototropha]|uniref:Uncharacterized protein n=1 Tax=Candidatus Chlorohelix allophototropha TaxID=3003348 RepID=A0ABY9BAH1_9CHLR|nr:hypothetical protein OZ401_004613 [Chloroflexota bacterium L227-S17]
MKHNTNYIRWSSSLTLLLFLLLIAITANSTLAAEESQYFPQTGHTVSGKFLDYWNSNGGLATYGYPITDAQMETDPETGKTFLTQWFERHRLELHPENAGTKFEVLTGLLGKEINRTKLATDPDFQKATQLYDPTFSKDQQWFFTETSHNLRFGFLKYWQDNGGLERFGYPISEEHREVDPETGKTFMMQWFERARFEYHPENQKPFDILLGLLGKQIKSSKSSSAVGTVTPQPNLNKSDLDTLFGAGNWFCFPDRLNGVGVRRLEAGFKVRAPLSYIDMWTGSYKEGDTTVTTAGATAFLQRILPKSECPYLPPPVPASVAQTPIQSQLNTIFGTGNWYCLPDYATSAIVKKLPANYIVQYPVISVDKDGLKYGPNDSVLGGNNATLWLYKTCQNP